MGPARRASLRRPLPAPVRALLPAVFSALLATGPACAQAEPRPQAQRDAPPFARLLADLSEPGGYFDTDNLISNESSYGQAVELLAPTGGVYLGGGIPPKILPAFDEPYFLDAFRDKPPMSRLVERMPVSIVLNRQTGLLGAAVYAATLVGS